MSLPGFFVPIGKDMEFSYVCMFLVSGWRDRQLEEGQQNPEHRSQIVDFARYIEF